MRPRLRALAALTSVALLVACGSTAQQQTLQSGGALAPGGDGLALDDGLGAPGGESAVGGATGSSVGSSAAGAQGGAGGAASAGGGAVGVSASSRGAGTSGTPVAGAEKGRGFDRSTVKIGFSTAEDASSFASSFGLKGLETGDIRAMIEATVADVNRRGGLGGRKVVAVIHNFNTAELLNNPAAAMQAACAAWTQDERVHAVVNPPLVDANLLQCLKKAATPLVYAGMDFPRSYSRLYAEYPDFFNVNAMLGERYDAVAVSRLVARGFFQKWDAVNGRPGAMPTKIGMIVTGDASGAAYTASMRRELGKAGLRPDVVVSCPTELSAGLSCRQAAGLRFKSENVTHVFGGSVPFMQQSEQQRYRPRYFLEYQPNTFAQNVPAEQLSGAMSEAYMPMLDVAQGEDPGPPTAASGYCLDVMRKAGQQPSSRNVQWYMQIACDGLFFVKAALDAQGGLADGALRPGFERLGTGVPAAMTWATRFGPGEHAGVHGLRDLGFDNGCRCFVYAGSTTHTG